MKKVTHLFSIFLILGFLVSCAHDFTPAQTKLSIALPNVSNSSRTANTPVYYYTKSFVVTVTPKDGDDSIVKTVNSEYVDSQDNFIEIPLTSGNYKVSVEARADYDGQGSVIASATKDVFVKPLLTTSVTFVLSYNTITDIKDYNDFIIAVECGGTYNLLNDIVVPYDPFDLDIFEDLTINGNGHTISCAEDFEGNYLFGTKESSKLTLNNVKLDCGNIPNTICILNYGSDDTIQHVINDCEFIRPKISGSDTSGRDILLKDVDSNISINIKGNTKTPDYLDVGIEASSSEDLPSILGLSNNYVIKTKINGQTPSETWDLQANISLSKAIRIEEGNFTINGNGYTLDRRNWSNNSPNTMLTNNLPGTLQLNDLVIDGCSLLEGNKYHTDTSLVEWHGNLIGQKASFQNNYKDADWASNGGIFIIDGEGSFENCHFENLKITGRAPALGMRYENGDIKLKLQNCYFAENEVVEIEGYDSYFDSARDITFNVGASSITIDIDEATLNNLSADYTLDISYEQGPKPTINLESLRIHLFLEP